MKPALVATSMLASTFVSAFGHGGEVLWAQGIIVGAGSIGFLCLAFEKSVQWPLAVRMAAFSWLALVSWTLFQTLPFGIAEHPSWELARSIDGTLGPGTIANDPQATLDATLRLAAYAGLFAVGYSVCTAQHLWLLALAAGIGCVAVLGLLADPVMTGPAGLAKVRHAGDTAYPFANRNHFCIFAGVGIVITLGALTDMRAWQGWRSVAHCCILAICLVAVLSSHSRSGLAAVVMGSAVCCWCIRINAQRLAILIAAGLGLAAVFAIGTIVRFDSTLADWDVRFEIMTTAWELVWQYPWTGVGSFDLAVPSVAPGSWPALVQSAHNIVLESLVERGFPATLLSCIAIALIMGQCARSIRSGSAGKVRNATALGVTTMVLLHGMVDFSVHSPTIAALVAIILGLGAGQGQAPVFTSPITLASGNPSAGARA